MLTSGLGTELELFREKNLEGPLKIVQLKHLFNVLRQSKTENKKMLSPTKNENGNYNEMYHPWDVSVILLLEIKQCLFRLNQITRS